MIVSTNDEVHSMFILSIAVRDCSQFLAELQIL